ncbi:MAG: ATP-dependent helicase [Candidatus Sericytochromatia bacterium]
MFNLKKLILSTEQEKILQDYENGYASVLATPGAGKTTIITHLIEKLVKQRDIDPRNILVLTLTESAAKEFKERTKALLGDMKYSPDFSTIHSFCNKVLRERYVGYSDMTVLPETKKNEKIEEILISKGFRIQKDFDPENQDIDYLELFRDSIIPMFRRDKEKFNIIKDCSLLQIDELRRRIGNVYNHHLNCFYHITSVVEEYESFLKSENFIDFDMMINETLELFLKDKNSLEKVKDKYKYVLEDEAQDSNRIQNKILELVAGESGNYIRVGDPNQSIFTTFTGADFKSLIEFYEKYQKMHIKHSNRSNQDIIDISNQLLEIYPHSFPSKIRIKKGDYNPNDGEVEVKNFNFLDDEINYIAQKIEFINQKNKDSSFAVLTRTNIQALEIYEILTQMGFDSIIHGNKDEDFFNNPVIEKIRTIIAFILFPYEVEHIQKIMKLFEIPDKFIEDLFFEPDTAYLNLKSISNDTFLNFFDDYHYNNLSDLCKKLKLVIDMIYSPVTEILETINNLFINNILEKSVARLLNQMWLRTKPNIKNIQDFYFWLKQHEDIRIKQELTDEEDYTSSGYIHILTVHKAKGLQWDAVFTPNFSKWDYKDETWNGGNERKDMKSVILSLTENQSRNDIRKKLAIQDVHESRRVAYVALTRAKKYLYITCSNKGLNDRNNKSSEILIKLKEFNENN